MDLLNNILWHDGKFLGIEWHVWKVIGWSGNIIFTSRFVVQWYATEKKKQVVVPLMFWWLSLIGTWLMLSYSLFYKKDSVLIFAYAFAWIPYVRNVIIHRRHQSGMLSCPDCGTKERPDARFCSHCGRALLPSPSSDTPAQA